jgi:CRISPR-associated protein Csb2
MDTALLAFDVDRLHEGRLVRPFDALVWMEALDGALARLSTQDGHSPSPCFAAKHAVDVELPTPHSLLLLPMAHDARHARMDHVLVHAPGGFDEGVAKALKQLRTIERYGQPPVVIVLVDMGDKSEFFDKVEHFNTSELWQSTTPFFAFDHGQLSGLHALDQCVRAEVELHGLPPYSKLEVAIEGGRFISIAAFQAALARGMVSNQLQLAWDASEGESPKSKRGRAMPLFGLRLRFGEPVRGPIVLGRWARHGMGQFLPG